MATPANLPTTISNMEPGLLVPAHRQNANLYLSNALSRPTRILWLTIMSQHTTEWLNREFAEGRVLAADIRVLTLAPDVAEAVIHAIAQHLNESPSDTVTQVKAAWHSWCKLSEAYPQLKVRAYRSVPTMQGVFVDDSEGMIEMMSFHSPPKERVGLFISSERTPASFATFWSSAANLWDSSLSDQALGWA